MNEYQTVDTDQIVVDLKEKLPCWNTNVPAEVRLAWIGFIAAYRSPAATIEQDGETVIAHDVYPSVG